MFDVIETLDRESLAKALVRAMKEQNRQPRLYVQVNTGEEVQKSGIAPADATAFVDRMRSRIRVLRSKVSCVFPRLRNRPACISLFWPSWRRKPGVSALSMGMSADFETAIQLGATSVPGRVGYIWTARHLVLCDHQVIAYPDLAQQIKQIGAIQSHTAFRRFVIAALAVQKDCGSQAALGRHVVMTEHDDHIVEFVIAPQVFRAKPDRAGGRAGCNRNPAARRTIRPTFRSAGSIAGSPEQCPAGRAGTSHSAGYSGPGACGHRLHACRFQRSRHFYPAQRGRAAGQAVNARMMKRASPYIEFMRECGGWRGTHATLTTCARPDRLPPPRSIARQAGLTTLKARLGPRISELLTVCSG